VSCARRTRSRLVSRRTVAAVRRLRCAGRRLVRRPEDVSDFRPRSRPRGPSNNSMEPLLAARACRPGAEHGRPQRQGCCASLRDGLRPPLTSSLRDRASRLRGDGDSARHPQPGRQARFPHIMEARMRSRRCLRPASTGDSARRAATRIRNSSFPMLTTGRATSRRSLRPRRCAWTARCGTGA
jgi:hypothetical protein